MSTRWNKEAKIALLALLVISALSLGAISMARGPGPSWNRAESQAQPVWDLGEVAARIAAGRVGVNRSGYVLWASGVEDGLAEFRTYVTGTGAVAVDTTQAFSGAKSAKLTAGPAADDLASISKRLVVLRDETAGFEFMFDANGQDVFELICNLTRDDGTDLKQARLRILINGATKKFYYATGDEATPTYVEIVDLTNFNTEIEAWHNIKIVADLYDGNYIGAYLDGEFHVIDADMWTVASQAEKIAAELRLVTLEAASKSIFADEFIITTGE